MLTGEPCVRVATGIQVEAHEGVAGLQQRQEHRLVHLAAGVRLDIGEVAAEQAFFSRASMASSSATSTNWQPP